MRDIEKPYMSDEGCYIWEAEVPKKFSLSKPHLGTKCTNRCHVTSVDLYKRARFCLW